VAGKKRPSAMSSQQLTAEVMARAIINSMTRALKMVSVKNSLLKFKPVLLLRLDQWYPTWGTRTPGLREGGTR
jgi:hypothetical protein